MKINLFGEAAASKMCIGVTSPGPVIGIYKGEQE